jgi:threonine dehydrogenase-like Zn-dependent dehydrogenase
VSTIADARSRTDPKGAYRIVSGGKLMKAAVVPAMNSPWLIKDVPQPQPGPGQVLVKMHASGICYTDVHQTLGHLPGQFPRILGHEPVGEIVAVAPDVTTRKIGDRVGFAWIQSTCGRCEWCQRGRRIVLPLSEGHRRRCAGRSCRVHADECRRYLPERVVPVHIQPSLSSMSAPPSCAGWGPWMVTSSRAWK